MIQPSVVTLPITGMSCANCVLAIESKVGRLPGVTSARVDLPGEALEVAFDPERMDARRIILCVRQTGFGVPTGRTELAIVGLRGPADVADLSRLLAGQDGVLAAEVNLPEQRAGIEYIPGMTRTADLEQCIRGAGFEVGPTPKPGLAEDPEIRARRGTQVPEAPAGLRSPADRATGRLQHGSRL
jgi:Cu+-exporting ATPase